MNTLTNYEFPLHPLHAALAIVGNIPQINLITNTRALPVFTSPIAFLRRPQYPLIPLKRLVPIGVYRGRPRFRQHSRVSRDTVQRPLF